MSARRRPVRPWVRNDLIRRKSMSADRELMLTRLIDAPRKKVYRAWTDAGLLKQWFAPLPYTKAWEPSEKPFMTVILTFEDEGGKTRYTARVRHWTVADRETHEKMGFHQGWGICADQLTTLVAKI